MFDFLSIIFRYIFIGLIYIFMFGIIRMIYLDVRNIRKLETDTGKYLKLLNRRSSIPYKIEEEYFMGEQTTIGRTNGNNIVLKDPYVSKKHCKIFAKDGKEYIRDLESSNGTFLNGKKITEIVELNYGDRIRIGAIEFLFVKNK